MADNLLRGAPPLEILARLEQEGVPRRLALGTLQRLLESPALAAGKDYARSARRQELVLRLLKLHRGFAPSALQIERRPAPSRDEFFARYVATNTPLVVTDLVTGWAAFGKWSPEHFAERYGHVSIKMTADRNADPHYDMRTALHTRPIRMSEFVARVLAAGETNDFYLVAQNKNSALAELAPLLDDVALPEGWFEADEVRSSSALWFGPAGTVTPLHHDTSNILFCQIYGRKRFRMISPLELGLFEGASSLYAAIDPDAPDAAPALEGVSVLDFVLEAGEALFLPAGYWHHVRALDVSISLAVNHFACPNHFDWYRPGEVK
jgi:hypothetical protein